MQRDEFEHVIAAAAHVTGLDEFVVIGSQAILGSRQQAPAAMLRSMEVDIYPLHDPGQADEIDGALGDGSQFQRTFGYYAHGVGPETAKAPAGWQERLEPVRVRPRVASSRAPVAWCLEVHDLVLAKCAAGRERDWEFSTEALRAGIVQPAVLLARAADLPLPEESIAHVDRMLRSIIASVAGGDS